MSDKNTTPETKTSETAQAQIPEAAPIATLLSAISYSNVADYENFLANLTPEHAVIVLIAAANHCQAKGIFNLEEAELIAKAIKKLSARPAESDQSIEPTK